MIARISALDAARALSHHWSQDYLIIELDIQNLICSVTSRP